jgi:DNA-binding NarL/FixJ family response regulator
LEPEARILIADDHPLIRRGLRQVLEAESSFQIVAEAGDGEAALGEIEKLKPTIVVLDVDMPRLDGLGAAREIVRRKLPVDIVFLTIHADEDLFHVAMDLGAKGYILKESALEEIVQGLRAVIAGQFYVSAPLTALLLGRRSRANTLSERHPGLNSLTPAELGILRGILEGKSSKQIGADLFIHFRTVETHRTNICQKLGLRGHNALFKFALEHKSELSAFRASAST